MWTEKASSRSTVLYLCHSLAIGVFAVRGRLPFCPSMGRGEVKEGGDDVGQYLGGQEPC